MDGWCWQDIPKEEAAKNASVVVSNYLMARTRQIERWDDKLYDRARRWCLWAQVVRHSHLPPSRPFPPFFASHTTHPTHWLTSLWRLKKKIGASLVSPAPKAAKEADRKTSAEALNRWGEAVFNLNVTLRKEPTIEFFWQNHYEMQHALFENMCVPQEIMIRALVDMSTVAELGNKGSEQLQRLLGEQTSQHGVIDLLVDMNCELDDFLDSLNSDLAQVVENTPDEHASTLQEGEYVNFHNHSAVGFVRSAAYAALVANDLQSGDVSNPRVKKVLELVAEGAKRDHFCLQQTCLVLKSLSSKSLVNWLVDLQESNAVLKVKLWRQQDPKLLAEIASKFAAFFKAYLQFLVAGLKKGQQRIRDEYDVSPSWYSSFVKALRVTDNYRLRIRILRDVPRLETPTKVYLSDQKIVI